MQKRTGTNAWQIHNRISSAMFQSGQRKKAIEIIRKAAREVDYSPNRHSYLRKQLLRFRKGEPNSSPPALS